MLEEIDFKKETEFAFTHRCDANGNFEEQKHEG